MRISQQEGIGTRALPVMRPVIVQQPMSTGHTAYHHLGQSSSLDSVWSAVAVGAVGLAAYHGYKRNGASIWTGVWVIAAILSPIVTTAVVLAQGVGKRGRGDH